MKTIPSSAIIIILSLLAVNLFPAIPRTIAYQGILTDSTGNPKVGGRYSISFSFYDAETGGTLIWSQKDSLYVRQGMFSTFLGNSTPFGDNLKFDRPYWLGIAVNGAGELKPRVPITSVGYCFYALRADTAEVAKTTSADAIDSGKIKDGSISGSDINRNANLSVGSLEVSGNVGLASASPLLTITPYNGEFCRTSKIDLGGTFGFAQNGDKWPRIFSSIECGADTLQGQAWEGACLKILGAKFDIGGSSELLRINCYNGNVGIGTTDPTTKLQVVGLHEYPDNATAVNDGLTPGAFYRTGDVLKVVHE